MPLIMNWLDNGLMFSNVEKNLNFCHIHTDPTDEFLKPYCTTTDYS